MIRTGVPVRASADRGGCVVHFTRSRFAGAPGNFAGLALPGGTIPENLKKGMVGRTVDLVIEAVGRPA